MVIDGGSVFDFGISAWSYRRSKKNAFTIMKGICSLKHHRIDIATTELSRMEVLMWLYEGRYRMLE